MKRTFVCLLAALLVTAGSAAAAQPGVTEISASGTGSVALPPDIATVRAGVETNAATAGDAASENNGIYSNVVAGLLKLGIARDDIALTYYNVAYNPPPKITPPNPTGERYGYSVSRSFSVKVREIGKAGPVTDACIDAGATSIGGVSFGLSDPAAARAQAMAKAVADARAVAEALAKSAGLRIVSIKSIGYPDTGYVEPQGLMIGRVAAKSSTVLDQSNVEETVSVRVVFLAEP